MKKISKFLLLATIISFYLVVIKLITKVEFAKKLRGILRFILKHGLMKNAKMFLTHMKVIFKKISYKTESTKGIIK